MFITLVKYFNKTQRNGLTVKAGVCFAHLFNSALFLLQQITTNVNPMRFK